MYIYYGYAMYNNLNKKRAKMLKLFMFLLLQYKVSGTVNGAVPPALMPDIVQLMIVQCFGLIEIQGKSTLFGPL
jgi:hypothetical protein